MASHSASLLGLPGELRNRIYEYVFAPAGPVTHKVVFKAQGSKNLNILQTCKQIHDEAKELAFSRTIFITGDYHYEDLKYKLSFLSPGQQEAIQYITLATHLNGDFADNYNEWSFGSGLPPAVTNFLWSALDLLPSVKYVVLFDRRHGCEDFRGYLKLFVARTFSKQLGTNPPGWDIINVPGNNMRYAIKSWTSERTVEIEYANTWTDTKENDVECLFRDDMDVYDQYRAPELRN